METTGTTGVIFGLYMGLGFGLFGVFLTTKMCLHGPRYLNPNMRTQASHGLSRTHDF